MNKSVVPAAYYRYWGKAKPGKAGADYHLLPYHSLDVAAVGQFLIDHNPSLLHRFEKLTSMSADKVVPWFLFMLASHDVGKFAEAFQQLNPELRVHWWGVIKKNNYEIRHDTLGYLLWHDDDDGLDSIYADEKGFIETGNFYDLFEDAIKPWVQAVTGHHGFPPLSTDVTHRVSASFQPHDVAAAKAFIDDTAKLFQPDVALMMQLQLNGGRCWRQKQREASWLLAGFAVLCDWLGSDVSFFCYCDEVMPLSDYWAKYAQPRAEQVIANSGILPVRVAPLKPFASMFPKFTAPTPLQRHCTEVALADPPQLFILEDVTGAGKTEAALMLVHRLMAKGLADGLFVALPTMATANAMYERMAAIYQSLYALDAHPSMVLSHSARHLYKKFQPSLWQAEAIDVPYGKCEDTASVQCSRWLADNRKKALLADVGIGTIDQALLGILPARHQSLRLLGISNKVLLIDEVHAYDHYMFPLLKTLLTFHASFGGSAILLSATLPIKMRQELASAWLEGRHVVAVNMKKNNYPLMTHVSEAKTLVETAIETRTEVARRVDVKMFHCESAALVLIKEAVELGQSVCWIRNTVHDAREAYRQLKQVSWVNPENLLLFHSRFVMADRLAIEQQTLDYFGEKSGSDMRCGRILIATQVVEQSLDLDFDYMVSDLAPIDLLIQRAGRLRRHVRFANGERNRTPGAKDERGVPVMHVFSPPVEEAPSEQWFKALFPKANYVYPHTGMLWLTARLLAQFKGWKMPDDARMLIEEVYNDEAEVPEELQRASLTAQGEWAAETGLANMNVLKLSAGYTLENAWDDEARIPTRLAEDAVTLYFALVQEDGLVPFYDEGRFPWDLSSINTPIRRISGISEKSAMLQAVNALKIAEKRFSDESLIIPLTPISGQRWCGEGMDGEGGTVKLIYDKELGLLIGAETGLLDD